jgi:DNA-binding SARP family transcriptional activator
VNRSAFRGARTPRLISRLVDLAGSVLTAILAFAATPAILVTVVGNPLGGGIGHQWSPAGRGALAALVLVTWVAWAACCWQLVRSVYAQVRRREIAGSGASVGDRIAARMAAGILTLSALGVPLAGVIGSSSAGATPATVSAVVDHPVDSGPTTTGPSGALVVATHATTYVVQPGDSLWSIAEKLWGDGGDWPTLAQINLGRTMANGLHFVDPNLIEPGWALLLPAADVSDGPPAAAAKVAPSAPGPPLPTLSTAPARVAPHDADGSPSPSASHSDLSAFHDAASRAGSTKDRHGTNGRGDLPELAALGLGAIGCAALARRARRAQAIRRMMATADEPAPSPAAADTGALLARFDGIPALAAFEGANRLLGHALAQSSDDDPKMGIRAVVAGPAGVDFLLAVPGQPAPDGFHLTADQSAWRANDPGIGCPYPPRFSVVVTVGDDDTGTWLVPLLPGTCLPIVGESADALCRAALAVQGSWSWADHVVVTDDPEVASDEVRAQSAADAGVGRTHSAIEILYVGDPNALPAEIATRVAVLTTAPHAPGTDLTVVVDRRAASLHPLARCVRPRLLGPDVAAALAEITSEQATAPTARARVTHAVQPAPAQLRGKPRRAPDDSTDELIAGPIEVRLLTATPRLDGLVAELAPNRARRAVELVAYLALHHDGVTGDRLRTRVLGSGDADAAAKTLFNVATAARRVLGTAPDGRPLFPPATRAGAYQLHHAVTADVSRAAALATAGSAATDPVSAMALLQAALSLAEDEPLTNALTGYTWWEAEGHGARTAAVLVNAATNLAALAVQDGQFDLAQWGLGRARLVDPYSEALSRTAMQVAAAAGDADELRRAWRECRRRIDELDPGAAPSPRTERLYGELAHQLRCGGDGQANLAAMDDAPRRTRPSAPVAS